MSLISARKESNQYTKTKEKLKYGFYKKSLWKDETLNSWKLFQSQKGTCSTISTVYCFMYILWGVPYLGSGGGCLRQSLSRRDSETKLNLTGVGRKVRYPERSSLILSFMFKSILSCTVETAQVLFTHSLIAHKLKCDWTASFLKIARSMAWG